MAQIVQHLPSKREVLRSKPKTTHTQRKEKDLGVGVAQWQSTCLAGRRKALGSVPSVVKNPPIVHCNRKKFRTMQAPINRELGKSIL
jgi:hypothetical protein